MDEGSLSCQNYELPRGPSINDLPDELLVRIMSYLPLFHRKRIREVCSHWEFISYDRSLIRDDWMVVPSVKDLKKLEDRAPYKKFLNLRIENVEDDNEEMSVWQKFGPFIKNIQLYNVSYNRSRVFAYIFKYCNNLKGLYLKTRIDHRRTRFERVTLAQMMPNGALSTLTSIMLDDIVGTLTDAEFNALTRNSVHLTSIYLKNRSSVSIENIRNLLVRQSKKLTHLDLNLHLGLDMSVSDEHEVLSDLLSCVGSQLTSLRLTSFNALPEECVLKVCALLPNLEQLALTRTEISRERAEKVFSSWKKLKSIVLFDMKLINFLFHLNNLRSISLYAPYGISDDDVITAFTHRPLPNVETLSLGLCSVSDRVVCAISPMIPNVKRLNLISTNITPIGLQAIINYNKGLRSLSLRGCSLNQMLTHTTSINDLTELRELELFFLPGADESWMEGLSLKRLRKLILHVRASEIAPWPTPCFATFIEACPLLEIIELPRGSYLCDEDWPTKQLSARARKILPLPCNCSFSEEKHLTQKCQF